MLTKKELWTKVHQEKVACPGCDKVMSRRAIRWRHSCRGKGPRLIDEAEAEERRQKYAELTLKHFRDRAIEGGR